VGREFLTERHDRYDSCSIFAGLVMVCRRLGKPAGAAGPRRGQPK
jgi:hypothetical protein